jgi:DNA-binding CsgD family transcriptional regulator
MAIAATDERDLLVPLIEGIHERPVWGTFLKRLLARTRATRIALVIRFGPATGLGPLMRAASSSPALPEPNFERFSELGLIPFGAQRRDRVYALEEMLSVDNPEMRGAQRRLLAEAQVADARFIRVMARGEHDLWLILLQERIEFGAGDSALLSSLAPHLAAATHTLAEFHALRLRLAMAEEGLALLGVGQAGLDRDGKVIAGDATFAAALDAHAGERPALPLRGAQALADACAELADGSPPARRVIVAADAEGSDLLLRPASPVGDGLPSTVVATAALRGAHRDEASGRARVIARLYGLSDREAALAEAISCGVSIVEAGAALHLSQETARNYTKRIYAKTGVSGQVDLVRLLLSGLAPLA